LCGRLAALPVGLPQTFFLTVDLQVEAFRKLMSESAMIRDAVDTVPASYAPNFVEMLVGLASDVRPL